MLLVSLASLGASTTKQKGRNCVQRQLWLWPLDNAAKCRSHLFLDLIATRSLWLSEYQQVMTLRSSVRPWFHSHVSFATPVDLTLATNRRSFGKFGPNVSHSLCRTKFLPLSGSLQQNLKQSTLPISSLCGPRGPKFESSQARIKCTRSRRVPSCLFSFLLW